MQCAEVGMRTYLQNDLGVLEEGSAEGSGLFPDRDRCCLECGSHRHEYCGLHRVMMHSWMDGTGLAHFAWKSFLVKLQ